MKRFRLWLANLISGGELNGVAHDLRTYMDIAIDYGRDIDRLEAANAKALDLIERMEVVIDQQAAALDEATKRADGFRENRNQMLRVSAGYVNTLRAIIAMQTPGANATVRRMARIAREALE